MQTNLAQKIKQEKHPANARDNSLLDEFSLKDAVSITKQGHKFSLAFKKVLWIASQKSCAYCGSEITTHEDMRVDHYIPKSHPCSDLISNYVSCCKTCNSIKCNKSVEDFRFRLAIYKSKLRGIISPTQAKHLMDLGAVLPIQIPDFHFEKIVDVNN